jgi:hypothetical protein
MTTSRKDSKSDIAKGLEEIMDNWTDQEMGLLIYHFVGKAFDVQPVTENAGQITATMKSLPGASGFRDKEGGKTIWHVQF